MTVSLGSMSTFTRLSRVLTTCSTGSIRLNEGIGNGGVHSVRSPVLGTSFSSSRTRRCLNGNDGSVREPHDSSTRSCCCQSRRSSHVCQARPTTRTGTGAAGRTFVWSVCTERSTGGHGSRWRPFWGRTVLYETASSTGSSSISSSSSGTWSRSFLSSVGDYELWWDFCRTRRDWDAVFVSASLWTR